MLHGLVLAVLLWLSIQDVRYRRVMSAGYTLLLAAVVYRVCFGEWSLCTVFAGMSGMFLLMYGIYRLTKGHGIGGGDVKLMILLGGYLGLKNALLVLFFGGSYLCIRFYLCMREQDEKKTVAFVPYLTAGVITVFIMEGDILSFV